MAVEALLQNAAMPMACPAGGHLRQASALSAAQVAARKETVRQTFTATVWSTHSLQEPA